MAELVNLFIDDIAVATPKGTVVVDAAKRNGIDVPVFCYHPKLKPVGMCRMCLVEIGRPQVDRASNQVVLDENGQPKIAWGPKLETGCTVQVSEGMHVRTQTHVVKEAQDDILEFLLTSHPLDCPICDKGGECPLQNLTLRFGPGRSRFDFSDKQQLDKHYPLGDLIVLDKERCIQCARCIRFQDEVADDSVIGFYDRGRKLEIATLGEPGFYSKFSGNTTDICPVGALTTTDFRFRARPWELTNVPSVCSHCAVGCNVTLGTRRSNAHGGRWDILRVMPRQNEAVNEIWNCDKGRFGHQHARSEQRLIKPLIRRDDQYFVASWDEALDLIASKMKQAGSNVGALIGDRMANEDVYLLRKLVEAVGSTRVNARPHIAGHEIATRYGVGAGSNFGAMGTGSAILVIGSDMEEEAPVWFLRVKAAAQRGAKLIVAHGYATKLERYTQNTLRYQVGSESVVAFGILNVLLNDGKGAGVEGLDALKDKASAYTPEKVEELTGVSAQAIRDAATIIGEANDVVIMFGPTALNPGKVGGEMEIEAAALARACANIVVITGHTGKPNNGLLPVWPHNNTQGTLDLIGDLHLGAEKSPEVLFIAGTDPVGEGRMRKYEDNGSLRVVFELFMTQTALEADVILPALSFAERDGTYTSGDRRVQRFYRALPPMSDGKSDWMIAQEIAWRLGLDWAYQTTEEIFREIATTYPRYAGLTYQQLAQTTAEWPPVGDKDLYFGGTAYDNRGGLGVQVKSEVELDGRAAVAWVDAPQMPEAELFATPTRRLYDRGTLIDQSKSFAPRVLDALVELNAGDAARLGVADGDDVILSVGEQEMALKAHVNGRAPQGVALAPAYAAAGAARIRKGS